MKMECSYRNTADFDDELTGFTRSMAELQWLLLILAMLYFIIPTRPISNPDAMIITMVCYAAFIMLSCYLNPGRNVIRWKLATDTWAMIAFITATLWQTGMVESPLLNLYLLVIIACAITLGKVMTLLEVALIASCYLFMGSRTYAGGIFLAGTFTTLMARFSPFLLVAYVTSMLASDLRRAKRKITVLSQTDDLTGLLNMRAFNLILQQETAKAARYSHPFTVLMIDVDNLKSVNDHYGHMAGSRLVRSIADSLRNSIRSCDVLARYGGDEFVILMPQTSSAHASAIAERIRKAVYSTSLEVQGRRLASSISIGFASFPDCVDEADRVLEKADVALYNSKRTGRNRVTYFNSELEVVTACA